MKTLNTIQTLSKIGRIVSKIVFVFCIVGFCLCVVGIVSLALGAPVLKLGGVTIESFLQTETGETTGSLYDMLSAGALLCAAEGILAGFFKRYFERELADGTPFTLGGAQQMLHLGILSICLPIGAQIIAQILHSIFVKVFVDVAPLDPDGFGSAAVGVTLIALSLILKAGTQLQEGEQSDDVQ